MIIVSWAEKLAFFKEHEGSGRTSSDIEKVLPEALAGRIDTLFVENRADIWGSYDSASRHVRVDGEPSVSNESLLNSAAIKTFLNGGQVYLLEKSEMPNPHSQVNAFFRF